MITYEEFTSLWMHKGKMLKNHARTGFHLAQYPWHGVRCYMLTLVGYNGRSKGARYNIVWGSRRVVLVCRHEEVTILRGTDESLVEARLRGIL